MTTITAADVKKLRDQTGAGMMECKSALTEANGNFDEANTILRKRGLASAAKKAGRVAKEGLIGSDVSDDHGSGTLVEVNCESDFVARTDDFQNLVKGIAEHIARVGLLSASHEPLTEELGEPEERKAAQHEEPAAEQYPVRVGLVVVEDLRVRRVIGGTVVVDQCDSQNPERDCEDTAQRCPACKACHGRRPLPC